MRTEELSVLFPIFLFGCPHDLPRNAHIEVDLLRRITGLSIPALRSNLKGLTSLGFDVSFPRGKTGLLQVVWTCRSSDPQSLALAETHTGIANSMIDIVTAHYCSEHGLQMLM